MNDELEEFLCAHAPELVRKLNAERQEKVSVYRQYEKRIEELEDFRTHVKDAVSQCQDKGFDVVPITVLEYLLEKVAK